MLTRAIASLPAILLGCLVLTGCQTSTGPTPTSEPEQRPAAREPAPRRAPTRRAQARRVKAKVMNGQLHVPVNDTDLRPLVGTFYFDYDRALVKPGSFQELEQHADFLQGNRRVKMRLEGHCDERGTREYNQALGERRAYAVRQYLMSRGVRRNQIEIVSYGEEKPAVSGSNESAWARNRRVQLIYM